MSLDRSLDSQEGDEAESWTRSLGGIWTFRARVKNRCPCIHFLDPTHVIMLLRKALCRQAGENLQIGEPLVTMDHIKRLIDVPGIKINLADLNEGERQNFAGIQRLLDPAVTTALEGKDECKGTKAFLDATRSFMAAFLDPQLSSFSFFALWRADLTTKGKLSRFVTPTAHVAIVQNTHNFVLLCLWMQETHPMASLFPPRLGSQSNESFFRLMRMSLDRSSLQSTFSLLEAVRRAKHAFFTDSLLLAFQDVIALPSHHKVPNRLDGCSGDHNLPNAGLIPGEISDSDIYRALEKGRMHALTTMRELGLAAGEDRSPLDEQMATPHCRAPPTNPRHVLGAGRYRVPDDEHTEEDHSAPCTTTSDDAGDESGDESYAPSSTASDDVTQGEGRLPLQRKVLATRRRVMAVVTANIRAMLLEQNRNKKPHDHHRGLL